MRLTFSPFGSPEQPRIRLVATRSSASNLFISVAHSVTCPGPGEGYPWAISAAFYGKISTLIAGQRGQLLAGLAVPGQAQSGGREATVDLGRYAETDRRQVGERADQRCAR